ncbi:MAG TPA: coproporphyrinogen III oxidase [Bacteroidetes bacterium]|nr:coproporphyrinogen III oxidase [Bacteroidota bacterium]
MSVSSLYLHIPFCEHKCIYCDFYSVAPSETRPEAELPTKRFVESLKREIELRSRDERFRVPYETIFLGGGTPSLLSIQELKEIFETLTGSFFVEPDAEITIEVNPGTVDPEKFRAYRALGINRVSMGVQSFHEDDLRFLTRIHSSTQAKQCVRDAYAAGFENVSLDLMFSLPGQTRDRWVSNLKNAVELHPTHVSCYSLIVEPHTPLAKMVETRQVSLLSIDQDAELYESTIEFLAKSGFEQYEVSNFARPGFASKHNKNYWNHSNYLGFGPSAHSFWRVDEADESPGRWWNISSIVGYHEALDRDSLPVAGGERLSREQLLEEEIFLALRSEGVDVGGFQRRYGKDLLSNPASGLNDLISRNMAVLDGGRVRLTPRGYLVCDEICASLRI